ncbi:SusC/RagA family TonB-linked outer membrane protein [Echinicola vietnamensis]|uniref:TonB-linked outer membrane protein, SusC/RagA family n=1 Tax=Echinicola vietnamensis (strain DSM 17526 / LMG 23754 / KMM 6221) TaxID=926556 RepID=L0FWH0_ECHVK|nr:SusC/RagA family TonB-linked outer membrane protein [Echinicola vietnamensis]AGA77647.1 TonB-linked outer membrane protein, SusC/RagA family [Echinicola vietnamensis DSM 17526]
MKKTLLLHVEERGCGSLHSQSTLSYLHQLQSLASPFGRKFMLIMKWSVFIIGMICLTSATLFAGEVKGQSILDIPVTVELKEKPLKQVLDHVSKVSKAAFIYSDDVAAYRMPVSISASNVPLRGVLDQILKDLPFTYISLGGDIVIKSNEDTGKFSKPPSQNDPIESGTVKGVIVDITGAPIAGATIQIKGTHRGASSNEDGIFELENVVEKSILIISMIGFQPREIEITDVSKELFITLQESISEMETFTVSTGYETLPQERLNGSFALLDSSLLNRAVSTDMLSRLNGTVSGLLYSGGTSQIVTHDPNGRNPGIIIRGISTLDNNVSRSPLIIVDNFPYEGDINNINPNDIKSITVLKDAAAASIWGARSGNGVIVITTKKGRQNEKMHLEFNSNFTIQEKPDLWYDPNYLPSKDYIEVEKYLFDQGYFDPYLQNTVYYPVLTPAVELLDKARSGEITTQQAQQSLSDLSKFDIRDSYDRDIYQKSFNQQYYLGIRGGADKMTYAFSVGYDKNKHALKRNGYERVTLNTSNSFSPVQKLTVKLGLNFSTNQTFRNNQMPFGTGISIGGFTHAGIYPYAQFSDSQGRALSVNKDYRRSYKEQMEQRGFKDWQYRPTDELRFADNQTKIYDLLIKTGLEYQVTPFLKAHLLYQAERQKISNYEHFNEDTYYTRNLINRYSLLNSDGSISYQIPENGGILNVGEYDWLSQNIRGQISFDKNFQQSHSISAILGSEIRELTTKGYQRTSYGYEERFGTASMNLDFSTFLSTSPGGFARIPAPDGTVVGRLNRFVSFFSNLGYVYDDRLSFTLSGRNDGTNLFGVNINQKITPLWSAGAGWTLSREDFFQSSWLDYLKLRLTYGYNGNVYYGSAYTTGVYRSSYLTGLPVISNLTPPNPDLQWERIRNINFGIDFETRNGVFSGTIELYQKSGKDLVEPYPLAHNSGFRESMINSASTRTNGVDVTINTKNINRAFQWKTSLLLSGLKDKITSYKQEPTSSSIQNRVLAEGKPLYSIFSYKWAGLDPENGDPQGYLNGMVSKDYQAIINNFHPDSLIFHGSSLPQIYGAIRNDFSFKGLSLSVNLLLKAGYYFRRSSTAINYTDIIDGYANLDYTQRWQNPGDEKITNVPSIVYPSDSRRSTFYNYSESLVEKGDHIRLQDIKLSYNLKTALKEKLPMKSCNVYVYLNNVGIIWKANDLGIDPDQATSTALLHRLPNPLSFSFGVSAGF